MGPFFTSALAITDTHLAKVWVGTRRPGVHGRAEITVTGPDRITRHYSRTPASTAGFRSFYPGVVSVTEPGMWVMTAQVGPDRMCAQAHYHR
jgi:hypothetical protein